MKKFLSYVFFALTILAFILSVTIGVSGIIEAVNESNRLSSMNASGSEYLGVYGIVGIVGLIVFALSVFGTIFSVVSFYIGQSRSIKNISCVLLIMFVLALIVCFSLPTLL